MHGNGPDEDYDNEEYESQGTPNSQVMQEEIVNEASNLSELVLSKNIQDNDYSEEGHNEAEYGDIEPSESSTLKRLFSAFDKAIDSENNTQENGEEEDNEEQEQEPDKKDKQTKGVEEEGDPELEKEIQEALDEAELDLHFDIEQVDKVKNSGRSNLELRSLLMKLDPIQYERYTAYKRSALNKMTVKKICSSMVGQQISQTLAMLIGGFSKVFIGEIVEIALQVKKEYELNAAIAATLDSQAPPAPNPRYQTPLLPEHLREAYRRYRLKHNINTTFHRKPKMFKS